MTGGSIGRLVGAGNATANLVSGTVGGNVQAQDNGTVNLSGGVVARDLVADGNSTVNVYGGVVAGSYQERDNATINRFGGAILGGQAPALRASEPLDALVAAVASPVMTAWDAGALNIFGTDLAAELVDANYQETFSLYYLTGRLADGGVLAEYFAVQNGTGASYHLLPVPEPSGVVLTIAGLACAGLTRGQRATLKPPARTAPRSRPLVPRPAAVSGAGNMPSAPPAATTSARRRSFACVNPPGATLPASACPCAAP